MIWSENRYPLFRIMRSALHQIDVLNRDRATVAEIDHQDGETDRSFSGGDSEHQKREDLADDVAEKGRERNEVDVDGEQDQLDRHQDDDDVLAVQEDAENAEREQDRGDRQVVTEANGHIRSPAPI